MDENRTAGMSEALRLTRAGQLTEALAVLQRTLGVAPRAGQSAPARSPRLDPDPGPAGRHIPPARWRTTTSAGGPLEKLRARLTRKPGAGRPRD